MLSLITPTSDRPLAFALCERWMARQTYRGPVEWIVADDGKEPATCTLGQVHIKRPHLQDRSGSFRGNLRSALEACKGDRILFIEDDDWYHPDYIQMMAGLFERGAIVGEQNARYYNVTTRRFLHCRTASPSLCQTGITRLLVHRVLQLAGRKSTFIDRRLWQRTLLTKAVLPESLHAVGIKGIPGKSGIGIGHRLDTKYKHDSDGSILRGWIGDDASAYEGFAHAK